MHIEGPLEELGKPSNRLFRQRRLSLHQYRALAKRRSGREAYGKNPMKRKAGLHVKLLYPAWISGLTRVESITVMNWCRNFSYLLRH